MKQLFRHTTLLLRTVLLLGALAVVNIQTKAQIAGLPDAFETMNPSEIIGDNNYYFIQFYCLAQYKNKDRVTEKNDACDRSYLSDQGENTVLRSKDYLPFAKNLQWTLVSTGTSGQFYLKSALNHYVKLDESEENKPKYLSVASQSDATALTFFKRSDGGYEILAVDNPSVSMFRDHYYVWAEIHNFNNNTAGNCLRFAKLKDNVAHIIYYQDNANNTEGGVEGFTNPRHYLTNSGFGPSLITNGNFEGDDVTCFSKKEQGNPANPPFSVVRPSNDGKAGTRGIKVSSGDNPSEVWDTQFFISSLDNGNPRYLPAGTKIHVEFDYRASADASVQTQAHGTAGNYHHYAMLGDLNFTQNWKHFSNDIPISAEMAGNDGLCTIAFNLAVRRQATDYFFDNIVMSIVESDVSTRPSIMNTYDAWALPTAAAYHKDGLWQLEEAGTDGAFYIKKYGTNDYLNANAGGASVLGAKDDTNGAYKIADSDANRYTLVQNVNAATDLAASDFYRWSGWDENAERLNQATVDFQLNTQLQEGNTIAGSGNVDRELYANLTGSTKIIIEGTFGTRVRVLLNRQNNTNPADLVELTATIGDDGKAEVDLSNLPYVHLNAIKIGWGSSGTITDIRVQYPTYLTHSVDGNPVMQNNGNTGNLWGFLPVEVPARNEDNYYKVLLNIRPLDNTTMVNYSGGGAGLNRDHPYLWHLEQVDDYNHYHFSAYENYLNRNQTVANVSNGQIFTYDEAVNDFILEWYRPSELDREVTHKISYLYDYAEQYRDYDLGKQGLATDAESDWRDLGNGTQRVNHFEITHYVKFGESATYLLPTAQNTNDHTMYQRWYNYDNETDLQSIQTHVTLNGRDGASVPYYLYKNGLVTGDRVYWGERVEGDNNSWHWSFLNTGQTPYANLNFTYTNTDGKSLTVAADVSRYSDMKYGNEISPLEGNLEEPSLTMRYIYYMNDAKEMASKLTAKTKQPENDVDDKNWLESKVFHFPSKPLAYETSKKVGYQGEFIGVRHIFSDYWVFADGNPNSTDNNNLVSAVINNDIEQVGRIKVEIYDPNDTGIRLGGYNPNISDLGVSSSWGNIVPEVGDYIRVYYEDKVTNSENGENNFNPRWKHGYDADGGIPDWDTFQNNNYSDHPSDNATGYFEAQISDQATVDELFNTGLRFQGRGFTMLRIVVVRNGAEIGTIWNGERVFDRWGTIVTISPVIVEGNDDDYQGFYFHDVMSPRWSREINYGKSRFVVFRYPSDGNGGVRKVTTTDNKPKQAYLRVYFQVDPNDDNSAKYQLAQYTLIFDDGAYGDGCATLPWTSVNGGTNVKDTSDPTKVDQYTQMDYVQGTPRDPNNLRAKAGEPIAKITFDYPAGITYHFPDKGDTNHGQNNHDGDGTGLNYGDPFPAGGTIPDSSPIPLTFAKSNYAFDGENCLFGAYALLTNMGTRWGNDKPCLPANHGTQTNGVIQPGSYGYAVDPDQNYQSGFLYIDASELPGDICSAPFVGDFCAGDHLMVSGWISGANNVNNGRNNDAGIRSPGGITLTLKGEHTVNGQKVTETLYRFCPGMCYELDNGGDGGGIDGYIGSDHVVWQQFYFEFIVQEKFDRHWIEVNNNCVSSQGGDFMLDNIEVYTIVPDIAPDINTPICVDQDGNVDMRLLKLEVDFNKMKSTAELSDNTRASTEHYYGMVFLEKDVFLKTLKERVTSLEDVPLVDLADSIMRGKIVIENNQTHQEGYVYISENDYIEAFNKALLRSSEDNTTVWKSNSADTNKGAGLLYFKWNSVFENDLQPVYSFADAVIRKSAVFRNTDQKGNKHLIFNGNYPDLPWKASTEYYLITSNSQEFVSLNNWNEDLYRIFNLCSSECTRASVFQIEPPYELLGLEKSEDTNDYVVCEGQIPTIVLDLKGYDFNGNEVLMKDINYDWWLGDKANDVLATLEEYHSQTNTAGTVRLDKALSTLRIYYPDVTDLDGIIPPPHNDDSDSDNPELTQDMIDYLRELVANGQLVLHQKSISVPAEPAAADDPYFYLVACPIHDEMYNRALNPQANEYVAFYCDEPQGLRIKLGEKAPVLKTGFVPGENTFPAYNYPTDSDPVLSIRLAKKAQFMTVQHGTTEESPVEPTEANGPSAEVENQLRYLWLPIRNAQTQTADGVIRKSDDYNIYLASTNDPTWDKEIYKAMNKYDMQGNNVGSLPIVGKIVQLNAINTKGTDEQDPSISISRQNDVNRLCVYFTENFDVREGYNYTLSLPFQEEGDVNTCDGTILINLKIVPDYEVWTGAAGNTDWNNDENWRRADGNSNPRWSNASDELYVGAAKDGSPLKGYKSNDWNYRTDKDQVLRKGFAPLYCTHVLMMTDEWGNAPVLYDAIDGKALNTETNSRLTNSPFPNLRDKDGWDGTTGDDATKATATPILRYDMQARLYDIWPETYGEGVYPNKGREGDLIAEMYQINSCDEIAFQSGTELRNAHLLNYNSAWVEYQLNNKRWYLLGSPLQGTISGEWYAPKKTAQQKTTYYDPVTFDAIQGSTTNKYDRYNPAIYQRSWDKAKAVLYEVGSTYSTNDNPDDLQLDGSAQQGAWSGTTWNAAGADEYLDRLGYKPMGDNKANVAIQGIWSNTYNDATVDYTKGGFSVMVMNHLKGTANDESHDITIVRLPKEDTMYDYWSFSQEDTPGTNTVLGDETQSGTVRHDLERNLNRGRLKADLLLPETTQKTEDTDGKFGDLRYGTERKITRVPIKEDALTDMLTNIGSHEEAVSAGVSNLGFYLVENPFTCGLDMDAFFAANKKLHKKYWLLTSGGQQLVQWATTGWVTPEVEVVTGEEPDTETTLHFATDDTHTANAVLAPGQGFFVQYNPEYELDDSEETQTPPTVIVYNQDMQAQSRYGEKSGSQSFTIVVGTKQKMTTVGVTYDDDDDPDTPEVPLKIDDDDDPSTPDVQATVEVPAVDDNGNYIVDDITEDIVINTYVQTSDENYQHPLKARTRSSEVMSLPGLVITAERGDYHSNALVMEHNRASNDFLPLEDTEVFVTSDLEHVPTVYTLCGRLATTINSIHDFRSLPIGIDSNSDAPCTLTFKGVEMLGDSIAFYDALKKELTPLESGMKFVVSGQTQNRYYLVRSLIKEEAAAETHIQIFTEGLTAKVIASTAEPITNVRCYDTAGRLIHSASPQTPEYSFSLPAAGIYIISAETENDRKTVKCMAK